MKSALFILAMAFSFSAFSFTTATLEKDAALTVEVDQAKEALHWSIQGGADKYCYVSITSPVLENRIAKAGTKFEIYEVNATKCEFDIVTRKCNTSFVAQNREEDLQLAVSCIHRGMFASGVKEKEVAKFTKGFITVK